MALHPDFPLSPYEALLSELRWFPAAEALRGTAYEKLLPPLASKRREEVRSWRDSSYIGASATSRALLSWRFETDHLLEQAEGRPSYRFVYVDQTGFEQHKPGSFTALDISLTEYQQ